MIVVRGLKRGGGMGLIGLESLKSKVGEKVLVRARVHALRVKGNIGFVVLRQQTQTVQCCILKSDQITKAKIKEIGSITPESIVEVSGTVKTPETLTTCSLPNIEIQVESFNLLSKADPLPFTYDEGLNLDRVSLKTRLDNRSMDLRLPLANSLIKSSSQVCQWFREFLLLKGFIEIHSPKLIEGVSEGGSEVFKLDYFGKQACLAQSPQLYKQMAVLGDLEKVFEIGPVLRAENSNTHRHLCEFTGLDLECVINQSYLEVVGIVNQTLCFIFERLAKEKYTECIFSSFKSEPVKIPTEPLMFTYEEASDLLNASGLVHNKMADFTLDQEKALGALIKSKFFSDFYVIHQYPTAIRPFYTNPLKSNPIFSESFDFFLRGEEIASGSRRIDSYTALQLSASSRQIPQTALQSYLDSFRFGVYPHGGCGLGLERLIMLYFDTGNIRYTSLFPRDPKRLNP